MKGKLVLICLSVIACTPVTQERIPTFDTLFIAHVESREDVVLKPNESKAARLAIGLLSGGIVGVVGTARTEKNFSKPKAFEYLLSTADGEERSIVSRSSVDAGSCVEVISPDDSEIEVLRKIELENCPHSYNKSSNSDGVNATGS